MKKIYVVLIAAVVLLSSAVVVLAVHDSRHLTADEAEKEYDELLADAQTISDEQFVAAKLDLLTRIADGDRSQAAEYAAVVRKITDGDYVFADEDVFSFVRELVDVYSALENGELTDGVQSITLQNDDGAATVSISHIACPKYTVTKVENASEEVIYYGERCVKYDGFLGDKLIKVMLYDTRLSEEWASKYPPGEPHVLSDGFAGGTEPVKFMTCFADHSVIIYIGGDIDVVEQNMVTVNELRGSIDFTITPAN